MKQQRLRQVKEYLEQNNQPNNNNNMPVSAPMQNYSFGSGFSSPSFLNNFSGNPMSPNSPDAASSIASGGEVCVNKNNHNNYFISVGTIFYKTDDFILRCGLNKFSIIQFFFSII